MGLGWLSVMMLTLALGSKKTAVRLLGDGLRVWQVRRTLASIV